MFLMLLSNLRFLKKFYHTERYKIISLNVDSDELNTEGRNQPKEIKNSQNDRKTDEFNVININTDQKYVCCQSFRL